MSSPVGTAANAPAARATLPPEIWLDILGRLWKDTYDGVQRDTAALAACCSVSRQLGAMAEELLYEHVRLGGRKAVRQWAKTEARKWTVELALYLHGEPRVRRWLKRVLRAGLSGKAEDGGRQLEALEVEISGGDILPATLHELPELQGGSGGGQLGQRFAERTDRHTRASQGSRPSRPTATRRSSSGRLGSRSSAG